MSEAEAVPMTEETWKRLEYYAKCCESGKREYILMGKADFTAAFNELTRSRAEVEGLREELANARKRYCWNCSEEMPEGVYEFCSEKCQEVFINIKTGQTDL